MVERLEQRVRSIEKRKACIFFCLCDAIAKVKGDCERLREKVERVRAIVAYFTLLPVNG